MRSRHVCITETLLIHEASYGLMLSITESMVKHMYSTYHSEKAFAQGNWQVEYVFLHTSGTANTDGSMVTDSKEEVLYSCQMRMPPPGLLGLSSELGKPPSPCSTGRPS